MARRFSVEVAADQFEELCRPSQPVGGVAELIWNGLDAEATTVEVTIARTELDSVALVQVVDNGHGMTEHDADRDFKHLGGSWKKRQRLSRNGKRALHGKRGRGRFRAFSLGYHVVWSSVAEGLNGLEHVEVTGSLKTEMFEVSDPIAVPNGTMGTTVTASHPRPTAAPLLGRGARPWLIAHLAAYLAKYPHVLVTYDGVQLDPAEIRDRTTVLELDPSLGGEHGAPVLTVMEWKPDIVGLQSSVVLCDGDGVALHELDDLADTAKLKLTGYLSWPGFVELASSLVIGEMNHATLTPILRQARQLMARYVAERAAEDRQAILTTWKTTDAYPYREAPTNEAERRERQVFDAVAITAARAVSSDPKAARLSLRLIKEALETSPGALHRVLHDVLDLSPDQLADFDQLLRRTSLPALIATSALVTDRLSFLHDLERLLFDPEGRAQVKERIHLHEILARDRAWVFGDDYSITVSDQRVQAVLKAHLALLGDSDATFGPVADPTGNIARRIDLMLTRTTDGPIGRRHLVVELKRPSITLGAPELTQIQNYAITVARNPAFLTPTVAWDFWLIGDDYDPYIDTMVHQDNLPEGVAMQSGSITVRVRRWAEVLQENRQRLHFYKSHLDFEPGEDATIDTTLAKYLDPPAEQPAA